MIVRWPTPQLVDEACEVLHEHYEDAAVIHGWKTPLETRVPWAELPESNRQTMRAAVMALFDWLERERIA